MSHWFKIAVKPVTSWFTAIFAWKKAGIVIGSKQYLIVKILICLRIIISKLCKHKKNLRKTKTMEENKKQQQKKQFN